MKHQDIITSDKSSLSVDSFEDILKKAILLCNQNKWHIAVWRLPYHEEIQLIIDTDPPQPFEKLDFEQTLPGFAVAPFKSDSSNPKYFLKSDIHFDTKDFTFTSPSGRVNVETFLEELLSTNPSSIEENNDNSVDSDKSEINSQEKSEFVKLVEKSIEFIDWGKFEKVVPSRIKTVNLEGFNYPDVYKKLEQEYPRAFVYLILGPETGSWMGATPEVLLEIEENRIFRTVSLAGTQPYNQGMDLGNIAWKQKEIEEQAFVSRYIINCFKKIRLREFEEKGPKTAIAGNLIHLKTTFEVDMETTGFSNLGTIMLDLLHPTSAVCGMPKNEALEFLDSNEKHTRKLYSGFLGPVNLNQDSHIYVNLRCMEIVESSANLYAGAGITEHSVPENEWKETELKIDTLLSVINNYVK